MAFCKYCGKQLADGEVCSCQNVAAVNQEPQMAAPQMEQIYGQPQMNTQPQMNPQFQGNPMNGQPYQPNPQMEQAKQAAGGFLKTALDSITHPVTNAVNCSRTSGNFGLISILVNLVLALIGLIILCLYVKGQLGMFGSAIPYAKLVVGSLVLSAATYFGYAASYFLTTKFIFKSELSFKNSMNIISSKAIWDIVVVVIAFLFLILNAKAGIFLFAIGSLFTLLVMLYSYSEAVTISSDKKVYAMFISIILVAIVTMILSKFIFGDSVSSLVNSLKSIL